MMVLLCSFLSESDRSRLLRFERAWILADYGKSAFSENRGDNEDVGEICKRGDVPQMAAASWCLPTNSQEDKSDFVHCEKCR